MNEQWEQVLAIAIAGDPMPAPRPRAAQRGRHWYMPQSYLDYRDQLRLMMRRGRGEWRPDRADTFAVKLLCYRDSRRRVDVDNLLKTVLDAGIGVLWTDDSQVVKANVARLLDREKPRLELRVWREIPAQERLPQVQTPA